MIPIDKNKMIKEDYNLQNKITEKVLDLVKAETKEAKIKRKLKVGIGGVSDTWQDIYKKFDNAVFSINIGSKIDEKIEKENFKDYIIEYNLSSIPQSLREDYIEKVLGKLIVNEKKYSNKLLHTLNRYFYFDMSIKETSEDLFLYRNTLMARLNRV